MTVERIREAAQILGELGNGRMANELERLAATLENKGRLLKAPSTKAVGCYCPPNTCKAPIIMGRQTPCLRQSPTIEQQIQQLEIAGWIAKTPTLWKSPDGKLFIGPHGAWKVMRNAGAVGFEAEK